MMSFRGLHILERAMADAGKMRIACEVDMGRIPLGGGLAVSSLLNMATSIL
jgi:hypothetical protein